MTRKFILVHGAWHSKVCWSKIIQWLQHMGHTAIAVQLDGMGKDGSMLDAVYLRNHVQNLVELIKSEAAPDDKITLMGKCYGGVVMSQSIELVPELIDRAIYMSGIMLADDESMMDITHHFKDSLIAKHMKLEYSKYVISLPKDVMVPGFFNDTEGLDNNLGLRREVEDILEEITDHPMHTFFDRVCLSRGYQSVKKTYIECVKDQAIPISMQRYMHRRDKSVDRVYTLNTDHSPYITNPLELISVLSEL